MAFSNGPVIPTNGLVLSWDAADPNSYPGSGTTIYDTSGNGNNGTLYNGVGFSTVNGGVLVFDGVNDYVHSEGPILTTTDCTVIGVARYVSVNTGIYQGGGRIINARYNNWLMGHWDRSAKKYYAQGWVTDSDGIEGAPDTNWHFYHTYNQYSTDQWSFYIDNALDSGPNNNGSQGPSAFALGMYGETNSEYSNSHFAFLLAYNRILTADEVTQIYNAKKSRFNLK